MKTCPKCKKKTLQTASEAIALANKGIDSIGDYMGRQPWRVADEWSCCSEKCTNPKCEHIK